MDGSDCPYKMELKPGGASFTFLNRVCPNEVRVTKTAKMIPENFILNSS
jgi:hypothetical protein